MEPSVEQTPAPQGEANIQTPINSEPIKPKNPKALIATAATCAILAVAGIAFGVCEIMDSNSKNTQISNLQSQLEALTVSVEPQNQEDTSEATSLPGELYLVGDLSTMRKYYFATANTDQTKDSREVTYYLIDTTKIGTSNAVQSYDLKPIINQAVEEEVASLPEIIAEGTVNATPKTSCASYKAVIGDVTENPKNINWVINTDWSNKVPITIFMDCIVNDSNGDTSYELSLGTKLYSLDPDTNTLIKLEDNWY